MKIATFKAIRAAFLADILAAPDEDAPRLIFADWLEEYGDQKGDRERAEFIRMQCELARCPDCHGAVMADGCCRTCHLRRRIHDLWLDGRAYWTACLPGVIGDACNEFGWWQRGFVERVTLPGDVWVKHADTLLRQHPIREVTLCSRLPARIDIEWAYVCMRWPWINFHLHDYKFVKAHRSAPYP